jgi:hypothetical protein
LATQIWQCFENFPGKLVALKKTKLKEKSSCKKYGMKSTIILIYIYINGCCKNGKRLGFSIYIFENSRITPSLQWPRHPIY